MAVRIRPSGTLSSLSLTPLIDIVFLLLIFFLVATRFAEEDRELDVELPTASEAQPLTVKPKEVFVNVDQEGSYYVGGHMLDADGVDINVSCNFLKQAMKIRCVCILSRLFNRVVFVTNFQLFAKTTHFRVNRTEGI